ncbi:MAG TPA: glycosyltransferase [Candidatus Cryosericum sp.]|nr:glycosyltransferase [Candidatus Cryosericum sp.]
MASLLKRMTRHTRQDMPETQPLFFSIVIPAHNEEKYIGGTLASLRQLDYPHDRFEVIIVENACTDNTAQVVGQMALPDWTVLNTPQAGVSHARNMGIERVAEKSDWVIFLDADTRFEPRFLSELNHSLQTTMRHNLGTGMVSLLPDPDSPRARWWYTVVNVATGMARATKSIQIIRRDLLHDIRYDETLTFAEDLSMMRECQRHSRYFYLRSTSVLSSTRRFEQGGWVPEILRSLYLLSLPYEKKQAIRYPAPR